MGIFNWYQKLVKLEEKVNSIVRFGTILEIDLENNLVIVDLGNNLQSPKLPYLVNCSGNARVYFVPKIGDQVIIISKGGSLHQGIVIPSMYIGNVTGISDEWRLEFESGSITHINGVLNISSNQEVNITSPKATIASDQIILGDDSGGEVVCKMHTCAFSGTPHVSGSSKIKGAM